MKASLIRNISNSNVNLPVAAALGLAATILLSGCSDPAADVTKSGVAEAEATGDVSATAAKYDISETSTIGFTGSKVTGSHDGGFKQFTGTIYVENGALAAGSSIDIDMDSTWSDSDRLTGHLKNADFFDVPTYPQSTFVLTQAESQGDQTTLTGNLALHGVTNSIQFPATVQISEESVTLQAEFAINRKDFNITYPGRPDDLIRDNVVLRLDVTATAAE